MALLPGHAAGDQTSREPSPTLAPPEKLQVEGAPPIASAFADQAGAYARFKSKTVAGIHPFGGEVLVAFRAANTTQLWRQDKPLGELTPLTDFSDPVGAAVYVPNSPDHIVFARATEGNGRTHLYRLHCPSRAVEKLTRDGMRHSGGVFTNRGDRMLVVSQPIQAATGAAVEQFTELWLMDALDPSTSRRVVQLPGSGWVGFDFSPDDKTLACRRYRSATESEVWMINLASGGTGRVLPEADGPTARFEEIAFDHDGTGLYLVSDRGSEFCKLHRFDLQTRKLEPVVASISWDIESVSISRDRRNLAMLANEDGVGKLYFYDPVGRRLSSPSKAPKGDVSLGAFSIDGSKVVLNVSTTQAPTQGYLLNIANGEVTQWTEAETAGLATESFSAPRAVQIASFDGLPISTLVVKPPSRFKPPYPVLVYYHGGPEAQSRAGFLGRYNYLLRELGVALVLPNVRGSAGYGKTFLKLDDKYLREDAVKDAGAVLDWIAASPEFDKRRVMVEGASYGGYMSLAVSARYPDRICGAIDEVGITHFVSFLERTEASRQDLRRTEYGDERDPDMRAFLHRISPLTNAASISKPLLVVQGKNDPRVPWQESQQIVEAVRRRGVPVWYLLAENEGHGFARRDNADYLFFAKLKFIEQYLLGSTGDLIRDESQQTRPGAMDGTPSRQFPWVYP